MNILITGASRGIGKAIARVFAEKGHSLWISARNEERLASTAQDLKDTYSIVVHHLPADLSKKEQILHLADWMLNQTTPDILVNNAGFFRPGNITDEPEHLLEQQLQVNLLSAYHLSRALLPAMIKRGSGHIFNICSVASLKAYPGGGSYSISKYALAGFNDNLREELKQHNIKVTGVYPGAVFTDSWSGFDNSEHRIMEATDIAQMVYAASQLSAAACVEKILIRPQLGDL